MAEQPAYLLFIYSYGSTAFGTSAESRRLRKALIDSSYPKGNHEEEYFLKIYYEKTARSSSHRMQQGEVLVGHKKKYLSS